MPEQPPQGHDPDDWWEEPAPFRTARVPAQVDEDWLIEPARERWAPSPRATSMRDRRVLIAAGTAAVLALLVIGLFAAGVFSSGKATPAVTTAPPPSTTAQTRTTTTATTTKTKRVPAPTVTLKPGVSGPQTKLLQRALASLGDSPGAIDGTYGPGTVKAVEQFQRSAGLTPDGVVGPKTLEKLRQALSPVSAP